jgi:hypothetical protein
VNLIDERSGSHERSAGAAGVPSKRIPSVGIRMMDTSGWRTDEYVFPRGTILMMKSLVPNSKSTDHLELPTLKSLT